MYPQPERNVNPQRLWYCRRGERISGPYPRQTVLDFLLLGRLRPEDEASPDQTEWRPLSEWGEFDVLPKTVSSPAAEQEEVNWQLERLAAAKRWADERVLADRRRKNDEAGGKRAGKDRREDEPPEMASLRVIREELRTVPVRNGSHLRFFWLLMGLIVIVALGLWLLQPESTLKVYLASGKADCAAPPLPNVNWRGCDKAGAMLEDANLNGATLVKAKLNGAQMARVNLVYANLRDADLSFADLRGVALLGANLNHTDLRGADLRGADLREAELDDAVLDDALLDGARWRDGRLCAAESLGRCD
jgi:hypothetical protein